MKRHPRITFHLSFVILSVVYALCLGCSRRYQTTRPLALDDAKAVSPIPLPELAEDIHIAKYRSCGQAYADYVRFHAPAAVCTGHVKVVVNDIRGRIEAIRGPFEMGEPRPITRQSAPRFNVVGFAGGLDWFDVPRIKHGYVVGGGPSIPTIWIDLKRELFFYALTD